MKTIRKTILLCLIIAINSSVLFAQKDSVVVNNDSINSSILHNFNRKLEQIEQQRINDSIQKTELEAQIVSLKITDRWKKDELQQQLLELKKKETTRIERKKAQIDSLKLTAHGFPVLGFFKDTLLLIYSKSGSFSAQERATAISKRIHDLTDNFGFTPDSLKLEESEMTTDIVFGEKIILSVSENDALWNNSTKDELAQKYRTIITSAVLKYKSEISFAVLAKEIALALLVILIIGLLIHYLGKVSKWTAAKIQHQEDKHIKGVKIQNYTLFDAKTQVQMFLRLNTVLKWFFILLIIYIALPIPGFFSDWAIPTYQIIRILVLAFMVVVIFPYLPNNDSHIFQGVSVFLGFLFTFSSAGSLSNIIAGLVLTYMRLFNIGDRVKIGEIVGDVIEKSLLVTRIRTVKNEIISIPNSTVMNSHTINYSSDAPDKGLIIHTTITIGYDVPWRDVHQALIDAALKTELILQEPKPFVLQTSLDDFYVSYQVNAYIREANKQSLIYSNLHQNIQDVCNEKNIEILSPHYRSARDGNATAIPASYLPDDYKAPEFKIKVNKDSEI